MYRPPYTIKPRGRPVIKRFQDIGDGVDERTLTAGDCAILREKLAAALGRSSLEVTRLQVLQRRDETRLRFNAPTAVCAWTLAVRAEADSVAVFDGEIELFHWLTDAEWELGEMLPTTLRDLKV